MASSIKSSRDSGLRIRIAPEEVTVRTWPLVQRPVGSLLAIGLAVVATWLAARTTGRWEAGAIVAAALAITLWRTWLPVRYELTSSGITQIVLGRKRRIPWTAIRRYEPHPNGVLLLPDAAATALSPLRGLYLPCKREREPVLASCEYYVGTWQ